MPTRSNKQTDEKQLAAARRYVSATGGFLEAAPGGRFADVDYLVRDKPHGAVIAVLEVKCRDYLSTAFRSVWAEERKVRALQHWGSLYDCPAYFVAEWSDKAMHRLEVEKLLAVSGHPVVRERTDRNDERDRDVVYEVPIYRMEVIFEPRPPDA